jgi:ribosome-associated protein
MEEFQITGEYIQLNQLIKVLGWCEHGADANNIIDEGLVKVNDVVEFRKRNKIKPGFKVEFDGQLVLVK